MNTLVIAPHHDDLIGVADEAATIANAMNGRILQGEVTSQRILDACDDRQYERIWFATHCGENGVILSNNTYMSPDEIIWLCNSTGCQELVLSACSTDRLVVDIQLHADVDIMFCVADVLDKEALSMATAIARDYPKTQNLEQSLARVARGSGLYRYLPNAKRREQLRGSEVQETYQNGTKVKVDYIDQRLERLERSLEKVASTVNDIDRRVIRIESEHMSVTVNQGGNQIERYILMAMVAIMVAVFLWSLRG